MIYKCIIIVVALMATSSTFAQSLSERLQGAGHITVALASRDLVGQEFEEYTSLDGGGATWWYPASWKLQELLGVKGAVGAAGANINWVWVDEAQPKEVLQEDKGKEFLKTFSSNPSSAICIAVAGGIEMGYEAKGPNGNPLYLRQVIRECPSGGVWTTTLTCAIELKEEYAGIWKVLKLAPHTPRPTATTTTTKVAVPNAKTVKTVKRSFLYPDSPETLGMPTYVYTHLRLTMGVKEAAQLWSSADDQGKEFMKVEAQEASAAAKLKDQEAAAKEAEDKHNAWMASLQPPPSKWYKPWTW